MIFRFDSNQSSRVQVVVHVLDAEIAGNPRAVDDERHRHFVQLLAPRRALEGLPLFGSHRSSGHCRPPFMRRQHYILGERSPALVRTREHDAGTEITDER